MFKTRVNYRLFQATHAPSSTASSLNIMWDRGRKRVYKMALGQLKEHSGFLVSRSLTLPVAPLYRRAEGVKKRLYLISQQAGRVFYFFKTLPQARNNSCTYRGCVYKHRKHMHKQSDPEQLPVSHTNICSVRGSNPQQAVAQPTRQTCRQDFRVGI